ncbi:MAG: hypothetical protein V9H26_13375 [Verrucomicrobiota bacterium]|jgi:hypothetical protein
MALLSSGPIDWRTGVACGFTPEQSPAEHKFNKDWRCIRLCVKVMLGFAKSEGMAMDYEQVRNYAA